MMKKWKQWLKEHSDVVIPIVVAVSIVVVGAVVDYCTPGRLCGGMTLSEMEALAQEYKDAYEAEMMKD